MKTFCCGRGKRFYEQFMQLKPNNCRDDFGCKGCPYHRPEWKYRFCVFTKCRFIPDFFTFKENEN